MSSNPPTDSPPPAARRWRPLAGWSLRTRLLTAVIGLLATVCLGVGVVTTLALRHTLVEQVDRQLTATERRGMPGPARDRRPVVELYRQLLFGQPPDTLAAVVADGRVVAAVRDDDSTTGITAVPDSVAATLAAVPADGRPRSRNLDTLGSYRVVARQQQDGTVQVTGLPLATVQGTLLDMIAAEAAIASAGVLLAGTAGILIIGRALRPLRRVAATAGRVAELPLDRGEVALSVRVPETDTDPRTEVGQVGAALNRMLGHVAAALAARQASETRVRQFVADASHELRTPLAAIRGYAEVTRRGRDEVPPDIAHALRRVESESLRMTTLVDDLLLLARLDSGRPLDTEPVDLSALLIDAVSDAHVAGPEHRWTLALPDEAVTVTGDPARLHQVLANLLGNARTHTPPGTTVTATLATEPGTAVLTVADNGPGIPADLQPDVFERFARGDTSRSRAAGSTGLGLSIVAAVVDAHHGHVTVVSHPGRTTFSVRLPAG